RHPHVPHRRTGGLDQVLSDCGGLRELDVDGARHFDARFSFATRFATTFVIEEHQRGGARGIDPEEGVAEPTRPQEVGAVSRVDAAAEASAVQADMNYSGAPGGCCVRSALELDVLGGGEGGCQRGDEKDRPQQLGAETVGAERYLWHVCSLRDGTRRALGGSCRWAGRDLLRLDSHVPLLSRP